MAFGLTPTGFVPKTLEDIRTELNDAVQAEFGASVDVSDESAFGQLIGIIAEREALLWELMEAVNSSMDPDKAVDTSLDALGALTGTPREGAQSSTVTLTLTGDPATAVAASSTVSVDVTEDDFTTDALATITALSAWAPTTAYVLGDRVTNAGRCYECTVAGTSAGSGGPTTTAVSIVDNTVTWTYLGEGTAAVDVAASSVEQDAIVAAARTLINIETPISGWDSAINLTAATLGQAEETDEDYRVRRENDLSDPGEGSVDSIRAALLNVEGVTTAKIFENDTDVTDPDGVPPHAIEALVQGGDDQDIFDTLLASVAAGIATHGTESGTAVDSEGTSHAVEFSRPTTVNIYVELDVTKDPNEYPLDGDDQIIDAIVNFGNAQDPGRDSIASQLSAQAFTIDGVLDVTQIDVGLSASPVGSSVTIDPRELAVYAIARVVVNSSDGTP